MTTGDAQEAARRLALIAVWHDDDGKPWCLGCDRGMPGDHSQFCVVQEFAREQRRQALEDAAKALNAIGRLYEAESIVRALIPKAEAQK